MTDNDRLSAARHNERGRHELDQVQGPSSQFDRARDPMIARQLDDQVQQKPPQRQGSRMVANDHPAPRPKPPGETGHSSDRNAYQDRLAAERRDAAKKELFAEYRARFGHAANETQGQHTAQSAPQKQGQRGG